MSEKKLTKDQKMAIYCVMNGHAKIITTCFGYVHCKRCGDQIGDRLASTFDLTDYVIDKHDCDECRENYKKLKRHEKAYCGDPFKKDQSFPTTP